MPSRTNIQDLLMEEGQSPTLSKRMLFPTAPELGTSEDELTGLTEKASPIPPKRRKRKTKEAIPLSPLAYTPTDLTEENNNHTSANYLSKISDNDSTPRTTKRRLTLINIENISSGRDTPVSGSTYDENNEISEIAEPNVTITPDNGTQRLLEPLTATRNQTVVATISQLSLASS